MERKVLVTGASGLIGRELCKQLSKNFHVVGIDNEFRYSYRPNSQEFVKGNLIDIENEKMQDVLNKL